MEPIWLLAIGVMLITVLVWLLFVYSEASDVDDEPPTLDVQGPDDR